MTAEIWQLLIIIATGLCGSGGLLVAVNYGLKILADIRKMNAEAKNKERITHLEMENAKLNATIEKTKSDETQETKRQESFDKIIEYLGETLREMRASEKRHQRDYEETEKRREDDYLATKELYVQTGAEFRQAILDIRREMHDLLADLRKGFQQDLSTGFADAITKSQAQYATRDVFTTFGLGFRFPSEDDPRWRWCYIRFSHTEQVNVYKVPKFVDNNFVTAVKSGEQVWIITDRYSGMEEWGFIKLYHNPDLHGCISMTGLTFENCRVMKKMDKTPPEGLPPITAVVPAPG